MKSKTTPHLKQGGTAIELALEIERIRKTDPKHFARIMRKLAHLERANKKVEQRSSKGLRILE